MKKLNTGEIRESFINYFVEKGHTHVPSASLIPDNDPTLLFTNAGMNQFKTVFMGLEKRDYTTAVGTQKCVRAGGKHNDLDNVGHTARHNTFFEMLGNFAFGEYFKKEAIHYAWDLLTNVYGLPKDKLYVSVYEEDDEAADIWHQQEGVPKEKIFRFGEKDNFWRMGSSGPCGPNSEIFYDLGEGIEGDPKDNVMGGEGDRFMEIWNLVFMQYYEDESGKLTPLPKPCVDTGCGLERLSVVLQKEASVFTTDVFRGLIQKASELSGVPYDKKCFSTESNVALRVLADHARTTAFLIADSVYPSNEGRGYVLRRIMRRAIRFGNKLANGVNFLAPMAEVVIEEMGEAFPELVHHKKIILENIHDEEDKFSSNLLRGTAILAEILAQMEKKKITVLDGEVIFRLYDTYGFPADLTKIVAEEKNIQIDETGFEKHMQAAKEKAKASWKNKNLSSDATHVTQSSQQVFSDHGLTEFKGYGGVTQGEGKILLLSNGKKSQDILNKDDSGFFIFDQTCFYAESGGQVGDTGHISGPHGEAEVLDCTKENDVFIHHIRVLEGQFQTHESCHLVVTTQVRQQIAANHSATHLLHAALKKLLGDHIHQAGSHVDAKRLRFDFSHNKPISKEEIQHLENTVNSEIAKSGEVVTQVMSPKEATDSGAVALFGEKYGDQVRVVGMGEFSKELCGGTHVNNTAQIRVLKIVNEGSVSAGMRRIEAITGEVAMDYLLKNTLDNQEVRLSVGASVHWVQYLESSSSNEPKTWIENNKAQLKDLKLQLQHLKGQQVDVDQMIASAETFSNNGTQGKLVLADILTDDRHLLSELSDKIRNKIKSGVVIVIGQGQNTHPLIVSVTKDLVGPLNAGQILKTMAAEMGGKGGGRAEFAQGAAVNRDKISSAFSKVIQIVNEV